jgi:hypothetical protein
MFKKIVLLLLSITITLATIVPTPMSAASIELTAAAKTAFDKTSAGAGPVLEAKLNYQYNSFLTLQEQDQSLDERIKATHYSNEETLIALRKQVRQINAEKINQLEIKLKQTKDLYSPLFTVYNSLNTFFGSQSDSTKAAVQLARLDIKLKKDTLDKLKDTTSKKIKLIRDILDEIDPITVQIKKERSAISTPKSRIPSVWDSFKQALRNNEAKNALDSITDLVSLMNKIIEQKQKIYNLELRIKDIQLRAKAQIPTQ